MAVVLFLLRWCYFPYCVGSYYFIFLFLISYVGSYFLLFVLVYRFISSSGGHLKVKLALNTLPTHKNTCGVPMLPVAPKHCARYYVLIRFSYFVISGVLRSSMSWYCSRSHFIISRTPFLFSHHVRSFVLSIVLCFTTFVRCCRMASFLVSAFVRVLAFVV